MDKTNYLYTRDEITLFFNKKIKDKIEKSYLYEKLIFNYLGFCHIPNFLDENKIDEILNEINKIHPKHLNESAVFEDNGEIKVIPYVDKFSGFLYDFTRHEYFLDLSEIFLNKKTTPLFCEYFNKPKLIGTFSPPHQDQAYYNEHFSDEKAIAFWIALDDSTPENGCLYYSTKKIDNLLPHSTSTEVGFSKMLTEENLKDYIPIFAKKGDCIIHHSLVPHFSTKNISEQNRRAIVINYRTSSYRDKNFK